ncbi:MAG: FecR family protein, partial [Planctomycetes bacterium]|nr:FecR family protein [Planctomycetota bacterium]
ITGAADVKWSDDPNYLPPLGFGAVPLGRKYKLDAGLMEITYDSGAKVILQGPCTYEVESSSGGYLALGKLTARVEKERSEVRGQRSDHYPLSTNSNPQSLIPNPLFAIRTPTAIVTDLGTEFGVEVDKEGDTASRVFRGSVRVQVVGGTGLASGTPREVVLRENESARVEKGEGAGGLRLVLLEGVDNPPIFVRRLREQSKVFDSLGIVDGSIFHDDFDGAAVDAGKWVATASDGGTLSVADGMATVHTPTDNAIAYLTGAVPLDFSGSPDDWWLAVRFKVGRPLTTYSWTPRHWILLCGMTAPPAVWEMQGFDLRVMQQGAENSPIFILGWWGGDNADEMRTPEWLLSNLYKEQFYVVKIHRKPDGKADIYLDDRLIAVKPLIASQNPGVLRYGDYSGYMKGKLIIDYVKLGALVPTSPGPEKKSVGPSGARNTRQAETPNRKGTNQ